MRQKTGPFLNKFRDTGTVDRRQASGRLRSSSRRGPAPNSQHSPWNGHGGAGMSSEVDQTT